MGSAIGCCSVKSPLLSPERFLPVVKKEILKLAKTYSKLVIPVSPGWIVSGCATREVDHGGSFSEEITLVRPSEPIDRGRLPTLPGAAA